MHPHAFAPFLSPALWAGDCGGPYVGQGLALSLQGSDLEAIPFGWLTVNYDGIARPWHVVRP